MTTRLIWVYVHCTQALRSRHDKYVYVFFLSFSSSSSSSSSPFLYSPVLFDVERFDHGGHVGLQRLQLGRALLKLLLGVLRAVGLHADHQVPQVAVAQQRLELTKARLQRRKQPCAPQAINKEEEEEKKTRENKIKNMRQKNETHKIQSGFGQH